MSEIWFISDTHFFHTNVLKFQDDAGALIRPGFVNTWDMNERMVSNWNKVVNTGDHVYHLGDVTFRYDRPFRELIHELKGRKRLVVGNHDDVKQMHLYFEKIMLWRNWNDLPIVFSHIPLREDQMRKRTFNGHGHIHEKLITIQGYARNPKEKAGLLLPNVPDPHFINLCVEQTDYTPVNLEVIKKRIEDVNS